jgi:hypothetical protein
MDVIRRFRSRLAVIFVALAVVLASWVAFAPGAGAMPTTRTRVMGQPLLSATQLASWYSRHHGSNEPRIPAYSGHKANDVKGLAQIFIDTGISEGVRGDIAFVQSMLETGWLSFTGSQIPPDAFNYAGIYAFGGRLYVGSPGPETCAHGDTAPSRCMGTPQRGVRVQIQLLRSYSDASTTSMTNRLISAPSDRVGAARLWEYFGGHDCPCAKLIWAAADGYGLRIVKMYTQALVESGRPRTCFAYAPATSGTKAGSGYWQLTNDARMHRLGTAGAYGDPVTKDLPIPSPVVDADSISTGLGYWLVARNGAIYTFGSAKPYGSARRDNLTHPAVTMRRAADDKGYWLVLDNGIVKAYGSAKLYGSPAGRALPSPIAGMEITATGEGYWLFRADGYVYSYGDAKGYGSIGPTHPTAAAVAMRRSKTGHGYWMMTADGHVSRFGDAVSYGDTLRCGNYRGAVDLLVSPSGLGYWIATQAGSVIPFGDAKTIGFPATIDGPPLALIVAG